MKSKKLLSLLLALMMMLSVVPMYASAAEALKAANVTQWPTISYKRADGIIYFGEKVGDALIINDDEVVTDANGNTVAGHFEFINTSDIPTSTGSNRANIKFVPDDTTTYSGFDSKRCRYVKYDVEITTPIYVDEINDPLIASEVEAGALLSTSTLSGGKMTNPYNPDEPKILAREWTWVEPDTIVNASGYYEAHFIPAGYTETTAQVYVKIAGEIPETTISEMPVIEPLVYDSSITLKDVAIKGGVAVLKVEGTVVEGTFSIAESAKDYPLSVGSYNVPVTFTPADPEAALPYTFDVPITVNKAPIKFVDENGNEIIPEITVPYGTKFYDVVRLLQPYVKGAEYTALSLGDLEYKECENGTFTVTASAPSDGNYETTELSFKVIVEPKTLNAKIGGGVDGYYVVDSSAVYAVKGTFDVYVNDELIASDVAYNSGKVKWEATENGTYTMKWVYNPVENDNFIIDDVTTTMNVIFPNTITYSGLNAYILGANGKSQLFETTERKQGTPITIGTDMAQENFGAWIITDANGNTVDLGIADLTVTEITFIMPAYDINITYKTALDLAAEDCDHLCHSDFFLAKIVWKVLTVLFRLFDVQQYCDCGNLHYDAPLFG